MSPEFRENVDYRQQINAALELFFASKIRDAGTIDASYQQLWEELSRTVLTGGKRLRPHMLMLAYESCGGKDQDVVLPVALAHELLHAALLIHDDIMDNCLVRHGAPNVTGSYMHHYQSRIADEAERLHQANNAALLGGDLLISSAYELVASSKLDPDIRAICQQLLSASIFQVGGGQLLDSEPLDPSHFNGHRASKVALHKTAGYSFVKPLVTGAVLARAPKQRIELLEQFGSLLGIAYQMKDDSIGVFGTEQITGKSVMSDLREGKHTFAIETYLEQLSEDKRQEFIDNYAGRLHDEKHINVLKQRLVDAGVEARLETKIEQLVQQAEGMLEELHIDEPHYDRFRALILKATKRRA